MDSVSDPALSVKSGHARVFDVVSLNANNSNETSALSLLITNAPSPLTHETTRWTCEEEEEEEDDVRNSTVHPFDITIEFVSALFMSSD